MENTSNKPIIEKEINLSYTKGFYQFFCKTTAKLLVIVLAFFDLLASVADPNKVKLSDYAGIISALWIVNHNKRKLEGIASISSSVCDNERCKAWRKIKDCICALCYAYNQQAYQTGLREHNVINGIILRNTLIPVKAFKALTIVFPYLRIESFGDVANVIQARNYIRIIKAFPRKRCAIWSKNLEIWDKAFAEEGKPGNTTFVASSPFLNKPYDESIVKKYPFIDHIFTVYTKAYAKKHNIVINCGGRKCLNCIKKRINCYFRTGENNKTLFINELKK